MFDISMPEIYAEGKASALMHETDELRFKEVEYCYTSFFYELVRRIDQKAKVDLQTEKLIFNQQDLFKNQRCKKIIYAAIHEALYESGINPLLSASEVELAVQISYIKGYLDNQPPISETELYNYSLSAKGGILPIDEWLYLILQINGGMFSSCCSKRFTLIREYFNLHGGNFTEFEFIKKFGNLVEDAFRTGHRNNGTTYVYPIADPNTNGQIVLGGSYAAVKCTSSGKTHHVHHLIPAKILELSGILDYLEGPCILMTIEDHAQTRSFKKCRLLKDPFFQKQLELLKKFEVRAAVEMEIENVKRTFGTKYNDEINQVRKFADELERMLKSGRKKGLFL